MALVTIRILDGADRGRVYEDVPTPVTIGREEGNDIQLADERVSRFHLKIQEDHDKVVLTDLDSTNGTKVNGEDTHLRILRFGDMVTLGRSVLLYGSQEQIAQRLASLRDAEGDSLGTIGGEATGGDVAAINPSFDFEVGWSGATGSQAILHRLSPPELPERLGPSQAAQLSELLEYLHTRIRTLLETVQVEGKKGRVTLDERQWQNLLDLQARLATYLRTIGRPQEE
ncbi:MAG: FHA domain-containing protein [Planctomycetia bacterium]|nr:FHA domain-containing protein [Planctomycetia bacterium]